MNKYEQAYKLENEKGVTAFLTDYHKLAEARFYANDLSISDMLLDFHFAMKKALTDRQQEVIELTYFKDMRQVDVANELNLTQQTVQEHTVKAIKNLATYHMIIKSRGE
ncbi:RNA polymerase sigma factor (sigma-70 family) [Neobacillus niacini]|uniref:sigma factor-like helix-turn-helix DNA-binding protein n=1 Tax=Neobacillus driksii TaxID=3035913 RepID=UPI0027867F72|nr:sigma factor-like helix-turn-helix DNA-binding protein [Neobacillus niacini]MDQ0976661.1 RNA polymerase sigma factor (sigma-70 family) [Neobacillus niacini]